MLNLTKIKFVALDITKKYYLSLTLDAKIHLDAMNHRVSIKEGNQVSMQDCAKALIFLQYHLHEDLKNEYLTINDLPTLWNE